MIILFPEFLVSALDSLLLASVAIIIIIAHTHMVSPTKVNGKKERQREKRTNHNMSMLISKQQSKGSSL